MGATRFLSLVTLLALPVAMEGAETMHRANPIRKLVTLLQGMEQKADAEGKKEEELHEKFMCYCKTGKADLGGSIQSLNTKIPELQSSIEETKSQVKQMKEDLTAHKSDRTAAKKAMAEATAIREKENKAFLASKADAEANIAGLDKAIAAVGSSSFLQTSTAEVVKNIAFQSQDMSDVDRKDLLAFLSGQDSDSTYTASGSAVLGIMKQLKSEMEKDLGEVMAAEKEAVAQYDDLIVAKTKSVEALTTMIEDKTARIGEGGVEGAQMDGELGDSQDALAQDTKLLAELEKECAAKVAEFEEENKVRAKEIAAIADTIKFLNSDDALELFKKTLPGSAASFVQIQVSERAMKTQALAALTNGRKNSRHPVKLDFITMAIRGKKGGFDEVIKMIDDMKAEMKTDQADDDEKKEYCEKEFDKAEDEKKELTLNAQDLDTVLADTQEKIDGLKAEIEALDDGIRELDHQVEDATEQRKNENEAYEALMASNTAAKDLLETAKSRLQKGLSFVQTRVQTQTDSDDSDSDSDSQTSSRSKQLAQAGNEVTAMMDDMIADLDKEMQVAKVNEKDGQEDYEALMKDCSDKRAEDATTITDKEGAVAEFETQLEAHKADKQSVLENLIKTGEYIGGLHKECDWLLENYEERKKARVTEAEAMDKAKAVLSGADFSLLQMKENHVKVTRRQFLRRA
eukprot:gnl/TRDRNA2_/TRDRNA2_181669_c0_seq1.p1 gnl/TRDRNA2_/TRDRNA2_181669_c0~~gnl/TRDRNA2_/TRDRNA2_181669_c0_seq1.p1  ORF type:complete len:708 (+),score=234.10 gnl/TRDRNA2_/TRDRNA2_181669_c0_seq1:65-2125(+)